MFKIQESTAVSVVCCDLHKKHLNFAFVLKVDYSLSSFFQETTARALNKLHAVRRGKKFEFNYLIKNIRKQL